MEAPDLSPNAYRFEITEYDSPVWRRQCKVTEIERDLPHRFEFSSTGTNGASVMDWMRDNMKGEVWLCQHSHVADEMRFELSRDAVLFKLFWVGG